MGQISSLRDGYADEISAVTGVFSATPTSATSALIKHNVCLRSGGTLILGNVAFTSASGAAGFTGALCIADGADALLVIKTQGVAVPVRMRKVGGVITNGSGPGGSIASTVAGQNG